MRAKIRRHRSFQFSRQFIQAPNTRRIQNSQSGTAHFDCRTKVESRTLRKPATSISEIFDYRTFLYLYFRLPNFSIAIHFESRTFEFPTLPFPYIFKYHQMPKGENLKSVTRNYLTLVGNTLLHCQKPRGNSKPSSNTLSEWCRKTWNTLFFYSVMLKSSGYTQIEVFS